VVGEFGFGRVVAVGKCMKLKGSNIAEVAFSVSEDYQGKRLGSYFIKKLAAVARESGITSLTPIPFHQTRR